MYNIKKTNRKKTISFIVKEGYVLVICPKQTSDSYIKKILKIKTNWIEKKLKEQNEYRKKKMKAFEEGEVFFCFGKKLILSLDTSKRQNIKIKEGKLCVRTNRTNNNIKKMVELWYKKQFKEYLDTNINKIAKYTNIDFNSFKIGNYKRKLGSCNANGDLTFNWKIVMMPEEVINYIIIHELCHIKHFNHSREFWGLVEEFLPDYKVYNDWIKKNVNIIHW